MNTILTHVWCCLAVAAGVVSVAGCGGDPPRPSAATPAQPSAAGRAYLLADEPAAPRGVKQARGDTVDGQEVAIVGRVGGEVEPFVEGRATFVIADTSLVACSEMEGDTCPTPWDFCCETNLGEATALVRIVDAQGETPAVTARELLGISELDTVVVRGTARRDAAGNLTILATGVFVRK
jgi:hypothetical protein